MFGSSSSTLILPTGVTTTTTTGGGGVGGHHPNPRHYLSAMGSVPYHPTLSFPFRKLPRTKIRASSSSTAAAAPETLPRLQLSKPNTNLYQILRIKQNASSLEIKSAYRKLAKQFHPDASTSESADDDGGCCDFMAIHNAYATLSDPTQRARYDLSIRIQRSSDVVVDIGGNENRSYGGRMQTRRWETDQCW